MLRLKDVSITPPGGFRDVVPETGFPVFADNLQQLIEKVRKHMQANKLPVPDDLGKQVEHRLCQRMPAGICMSPDNQVVTSKAYHTPESVLNHTLSLSHRIGVAPLLSEARAGICCGCEANVRRGGCQSCNGTGARLREILSGRTTKYDSMLHVCDRVGVYAKVLVHQKTVKGLKIESLPEKCWIRKEA